MKLPNNWTPRSYQEDLWAYREAGGREAVAVWHRRAGKDEVGLHSAACESQKRPANYWHMLPEASQARKAIWDAVNPKTGKRRIDEAFPDEIRSSIREQEMFIKFKNGASWQVVGSDNFNSLVGSSPAGIVYSEWALAKPSARAFLRPIIADNHGWELFLYTPRGRNHGMTTLESAKKTHGSFAQVLTAHDTGAISSEILDREQQGYINEYGREQGEAFFRQEYFCDFNAAVLGSILAKQVERAEHEGRIGEHVNYDPEGAPIEISADIGYRDTAAWWFWQPKIAGFSLINYVDGNGMNAGQWCEKLDEIIKSNNYKLGKIWLPHDAKHKQFAAQFSAQEQFWDYFGVNKVEIVPPTSKSDRINAARVVIEQCEFNSVACEDGIEALRAWMFEWDEDRKEFSTEPRHDWASHPSDGFSYGAQIMRHRKLSKAEQVTRYPLDRTFNEWVAHLKRKRLTAED